MKKSREYKTKKTYRQKGGLRGIELGHLKAWDGIKVLAIKHEVSGWKLHYISEDNLICLDKKKMINGKDLVKDESECYNCGCGLKPVCPNYEGNKMQIRIQRLHEEAKMPVRAHATDAGMDLFFCPPPNDMIPKQIESIFPHGQAVLPTGLKIEVPEGYMLEIKNKSGIASKRGLLVGACVVDRGYTGEIFVNLHNPSDRNQTLHAGDKIAQAVFVKITTDLDLVEAENIYDEETSRGAGALGSTGDR